MKTISEPKMVAVMRSMPISCKQEAHAFIAVYRHWLDAISTYGCNQMALKNSKPACVTHADIFRKAVAAYEIAEANYWQMSYEDARKAYNGIPRSTWAAGRIRRGLDA